MQFHLGPLSFRNLLSRTPGKGTMRSKPHSSRDRGGVPVVAQWMTWRFGFRGHGARSSGGQSMGLGLRPLTIGDCSVHQPRQSFLGTRGRLAGITQAWSRGLITKSRRHSCDAGDAEDPGSSLPGTKTKTKHVCFHRGPLVPLTPPTPSVPMNQPGGACFPPLSATPWSHRDRARGPLQ